MTLPARQPVAVAITGASGAQYALRLLECLIEADEQVQLMLSEAGQVVIGMETDLSLPGRTREIQRFLTEYFAADEGQLQVFGRKEWTAPVASGSSAPRAMAVCPCTMGTLSAIACGASRTLIERAADVMLKEGRKLILVPRETPFSAIHLENMLRLARLGAVMLAANPGFYHRPRTLEDIVDFLVARILDQLEVPHTLSSRWGDLCEE